MFHFKTKFKLFFVLLLSIILCGELSSFAQGLIRERIQQKLAQNRQNQSSNSCKQTKIAGLDIAIWQPSESPAPLIIFSHGFGGKNTQSIFIMQALADAGYLVMAPNHKDSFVNGTHNKHPDASFRDASQWSDNTYRDRHDDIVRLIAALKENSTWNKEIDWSKVALCGHSLGGYTVLGLGGAWNSWKQPGIKAILALSPYCEPFVFKGDLANIGIPVMYQGGTRDLGITPTIKNLRGALSKTSSPAYFVEFDKVSHFGWTNFNKNKEQKDLINYYCLAFLDKYVKGNMLAKPETKLAGVSDLRTK
jgi:predicted dienelactone hydrolase